MDERKFLIIDRNMDGRGLLVRTLRRKFPSAEVFEVLDAGSSVALAGSIKFDAIITHRPEETDGLEMVRTLRNIDADVPIIMVSGVDRTKEALEAGATAFLNYDEWLRIGVMVAELLKIPSSKTPWPSS